MGYQVNVRQEGMTGFDPWYGIPDVKAQAIWDDDDTAISFARALITKFEAHPTEKDAYYRYLDGHKFLFKPEEENKAMAEIMGDFLLHGRYEPHTTELVKRHVKEGDVCVDVGASHGYFTLLFASLVGKTGQVFAIEPTTNQFPYLQENIRANGYQDIVKAHNVGAWSFAGMPHLKVNLGGAQEFPTVALDDILPSKVDFIKIDTDGAEPEVLKGLERTVQNNPQLKVVIEYYPKYVANLGLDIKDVDNFLDRYFDCVTIEGDLGDNGCYNLFCTRKV